MTHIDKLLQIKLHCLECLQKNPGAAPEVRAAWRSTIFGVDAIRDQFSLNLRLAANRKLMQVAQGARQNISHLKASAEYFISAWNEILFTNPTTHRQ